MNNANGDKNLFINRCASLADKLNMQIPFVKNSSEIQPSFFNWGALVHKSSINSAPNDAPPHNSIIVCITKSFSEAKTFFILRPRPHRCHSCASWRNKWKASRRRRKKKPARVIDNRLCNQEHIKWQNTQWLWWCLLEQQNESKRHFAKPEWIKMMDWVM